MALKDENLLLLGAGTYSICFRPPLDLTEKNINVLLAAPKRLLTAL